MAPSSQKLEPPGNPERFRARDGPAEVRVFLAARETIHQGDVENVMAGIRREDVNVS
jgi:hypothetical protein